jgi:ubiquinone/menaquinone biosynthesis C-methylase UbiE
MTARASEMSEMERLSSCLLCGGVRVQSVDAEYNICECQECGYVFDNPRPTLRAIINFYSKPRKYDSWLAVEKSREALWTRRLNKLIRYSRRGNLLDVGAGTGQFLSLAKPYFDRLTGTEVSETGLAIAKEKYGLDLTQGQVEDSSLREDNFDVVTLFHVLEHVPDPKKTIERCKELLKVGGLLLICVPNDVLSWTSKIKIFARLLGLPAFQKFSPKLGMPRVFTSSEIHLSHFSPPVLRRFLEQEGFIILEESLDPYYASTGLGQVMHKSYYSLHQALFGLTHHNRYDTIWMLARKQS